MHHRLGNALSWFFSENNRFANKFYANSFLKAHIPIYRIYSTYINTPINYKFGKNQNCPYATSGNSLLAFVFWQKKRDNCKAHEGADILSKHRHSQVTSTVSDLCHSMPQDTNHLDWQSVGAIIPFSFRISRTLRKPNTYRVQRSLISWTTSIKEWE